MRGLLNRKPLPNPLLKGEGTFNIDLDLAENNFRKRSIASKIDLSPKNYLKSTYIRVLNVECIEDIPFEMISNLKRIKSNH